MRNSLLFSVFTFFFPLVSLAVSPGRTINEVRTSIEKIRREAEENRERLRRTMTREKNVLTQVDSLDQEMALARTYLKRLDAEAEQLTQEKNEADIALKDSEQRLSKRQTGFARRLRDIYKRGRRLQGLRGLQVLLSVDSVFDLLRRSRYLSAVAKQDRKDFEAILKDRDAVAATRARLFAQEDAFETIRKEKQTQVGSLGEQVRARKRFLTRVRKNVKVYKAAEAQLSRDRKRSEDALRELIAEAERAGKRIVKHTGTFSGLRGRMRWPITGKVVSRFGRVQDPKLKTWTFNRGIEIKAPEGSRIRSIAVGEVAAVDWFRGYGLFALVGHDDGYYTLYAHLREVFVQVEDSVQAGETIAISGNTGTLDQRSTLHFEIMKGSDPEDPMQWLE